MLPFISCLGNYHYGSGFVGLRCLFGVGITAATTATTTRLNRSIFGNIQTLAVLGF